jgi:tetratricopeptide (TPR) repeat protein
MAYKKRFNDEFGSPEGLSEDEADSSTDVDFYTGEVNRYADTVERDLSEAFKRYGFTLYHSLPAPKQLVLAQKLGFLKNDAIDQFNLAGLVIAEEDYQKAAKLLTKVLELDNTLADAEYNLALCLEKLGNKAEAIPHWVRFQELTEVDEDRAEVDAHLAELRA